MNKTAFTVVCILCGMAAVLLVVLRIMNAFAVRHFFSTIVFVLVLLPALAWLRLRFEGRRKQREADFERKVLEVATQPSRPGSGAVRSYRGTRRRFVAGGILSVGIALSFLAPNMVLTGTRIPGGWLMALMGAVLLFGEMTGINVFRGGPLDRRLDPPSPPGESDRNRKMERGDE